MNPVAGTDVAGPLAAFLRATEQLSPLGLRQAGFFASRAAQAESRPGLHALLLLLLRWHERGAAAVGPDLLLAPLAAGELDLARRGCEAWDPAWDGLAGRGDLCDLLEAMLADPAPWAPVLGRPGGPLPLVVADAGRREFAFSRSFSAARRLEEGLRRRLRPLEPLAAAEEERLLEALGRTLAARGGQPLHWRQAAACALALRARTLVVSGGPGTGKTSVAVQVLRALLAADPGLSPGRVALAAPTGRAKARLAEAVGREVPGAAAFTLHRLLGVRPDGACRHDRDNRLPWRVVVVDEASMVDLHLFAALVEALEDDARLVLLGDMHQLPSVDAGAVLGDLTAAFQGSAGLGSLLPATDAWLGRALARLPCDNPGGEAATLRLEEALLPAAGALADHAVVLAHSYRSTPAIQRACRAVNDGDAERAAALLGAGPECAFLDAEPRQARERVEAWWSGRAEAYAAAIAGLRGAAPEDPARAPDLERAFRALLSFRVLAARHAGALGRHELNRLADRVFRPVLDPGTEQDWYHGRQAILTVNRHDLGLYNGDLGLVVRSDRGLLAVFRASGGPACHPPHLLAGLEPAWAMTVHKAQGSEFDEVLLALPERDTPLLTRQILYTGLTRARSAVQVVGSLALLRAGVARRDERPGGVRVPAAAGT